MSRLSKRSFHSSLSAPQGRTAVSEVSSTEEEILRPVIKSRNSHRSKKDGKLSPSTAKRQSIHMQAEPLPDLQSHEKRTSLLSEQSSTSSYPYHTQPASAHHRGLSAPLSSERSSTSSILYRLPSPPKLAISPSASARNDYFSAKSKERSDERSSRSSSPVKPISRIAPIIDTKMVATPPRPGSPAKRALSPVVASRMAQFDQPASSKETPPLPLRIRTKSASQPSLSSVSSTSTSRQAVQNLFDFPIPPPTASLPASKSTSELVKIYEQRSTPTIPALSVINASPVKDWLQSVNTPSDARSMVSMQSQRSFAQSMVSSASEAQTSVSRRRSKSDAAGLRRASATREPIKRMTSSSEGSEDASPTTEKSMTEKAPSIPRSPSVLSASSVVSTSAASSVHKVRSFAEASLDDSQIVCFGDIMWLNSSSRSAAPVWQACRGIITRDEQMHISWRTPENDEERNFDLRKCQSATSVRRNGHGAYAVVENGAPAVEGGIDDLAGAIVPSAGTVKDRLHVI